jgi:hypothetical protein
MHHPRHRARLPLLLSINRRRHRAEDRLPLPAQQRRRLRRLQIQKHWQIIGRFFLNTFNVIHHDGRFSGLNMDTMSTRPNSRSGSRANNSNTLSIMLRRLQVNLVLLLVLPLPTRRHLHPLLMVPRHHRRCRRHHHHPHKNVQVRWAPPAIQVNPQVGLRDGQWDFNQYTRTFKARLAAAFSKATIVHSYSCIYSDCSYNGESFISTQNKKIK